MATIGWASDDYQRELEWNEEVRRQRRLYEAACMDDGTDATETGFALWMRRLESSNANRQF